MKKIILAILFLVLLGCSRDREPKRPAPRIMQTGVIVATEQAWFGARTSIRDIENGRIYRHTGILGARGDTVVVDRTYIKPE